jgi:glutathione S-transferase
MLLYDSPVSGNCYKVRLLFAHLGVAYERQTVDVVDRSDRPQLLGELNPAQRVPTLVLDDGRSLAESGAILWFFGEGTRFVPADAFARAHVLQWMFFEQYDHEPAIAGPRSSSLGAPSGLRPATARSMRWNAISPSASGSSAMR